MSLVSAYNEIITLFLAVVVGMVVVRKKIVSEGFRKDLSQFLFYVSIPATMIKSMSQEFSQDTLFDVISMVGMSIGFLCFGLLIKTIGLKLLRETDVRRTTVYEYIFVITNYGFMGWPVCYALFGDDGMFYSSIFAIPINIFFYIYGSIVFSKINGTKGGLRIRTLLSPPNIATVVGLLLFLFSIQLPPQILGVVKLFSATTTPLAMAVAGMLLASFSFKTVFTNKNAFVFAGLRLLVLPLILFGILKLFGFNGLLLAIPVVISAMPAPPNLTVLTEQYQADSYLAAQLIFITTLLSVLTIPIIAALAG